MSGRLRFSSSLRLPLGLESWAIGAAILFAKPAFAADARDPAAAEALFAEGKALMQSGDYPKACPKLEESYRLDPATGALYAVAVCHERVGKLATAWVEFIDVAARANAEHNAEREQAARQHAEALEPRLSFLVVRVDPTTAELSGLSISRDGVALRPAAWGTPIPIDPGRHVLRAAAPGHEPWSRTVDIAAQRQREVVEVPELTPSASSGTPHPFVKDAVAPMPPRLAPLQIAGIAVGGAAAASLVFTGFMAWRALDKKENCSNGCKDDAFENQIIANEAANWTTAGAITTGVLAATAGGLLFFGRPSRASKVGGRSSVVISLGSIRVRHEF